MEEASFDFIQVIWVEASLWKWKTWIQILPLLAQAQVCNVFPRQGESHLPSSGLFWMGVISIALVLPENWAGNISGRTKAWNQQQQGGSSSYTGPALRLVTLAYKRQKEQRYIAKCNVVQRQLNSWRAEPVNIDSMVQHGKSFTSFAEELCECGVSIAGYWMKSALPSGPIWLDCVCVQVKIQALLCPMDFPI